MPPFTPPVEDPDTDDVLPHEGFSAEVAELEAAIVRFKPKDANAAQAVTRFAQDFFGPFARRQHECYGGSFDAAFDMIDGLEQQMATFAANLGNILSVAQTNALAEQLAHAVLANSPVEIQRGLAEAYARASIAAQTQLQALVEALQGLQDSGEELEEGAEGVETPSVAEATADVEEEPAGPVSPPITPTAPSGIKITLPGMAGNAVVAKAG